MSILNLGVDFSLLFKLSQCSGVLTVDYGLLYLTVWKQSFREFAV